MHVPPVVSLMQQRIIPFRTIEVALRYAGLVADLSGAKVLFVLPNGAVLEYNGQVIMVIARDEEGG